MKGFRVPAVVTTVLLSAVLAFSHNPYGLPKSLLPLWNSMTTREKAGQMMMVYMAPVEFCVAGQFGGLLVMRPHLKNLNKFKKSVEEINNRQKVKPFVTIDQEGGFVNRVKNIHNGFEHTPSAKEMSKMDTDKVLESSAKIAKVLEKYGFNLNLAPALDPAKNSLGHDTYIEQFYRSWGDDTASIAQIRAYINGMKAHGILSTAKHFPGYDSETNSDLQVALSEASAKDIRKYTNIFKVLSKDLPVTMMSSVQFSKISNSPAVFDPKIVKMARDIMPETVILTDDLWGTSLRTWISGKDKVDLKNYPREDFRKLVLTALDAGNDMFMITFPDKAVEMINLLESLAQNDPRYLRRIEESCARILKMKYKAGIIPQTN